MAFVDGAIMFCLCKEGFTEHIWIRCAMLYGTYARKRFVQKGCKNGDFCTFYNNLSKNVIWMLLTQFHLSNGFPRYIRENTNFLWQKPWWLQSAKMNFKGWNNLVKFGLVIYNNAQIFRTGFSEVQAGKGSAVLPFLHSVWTFLP